ncbi:MAG: bifunctional folylpolyglutamate synthase/dihydrofolate synthase [Flavobacteriales bacterium]|nr:bifunctional folylpolyglutamate synthase/dihydrofolate synthase [Flavobacteriales bacterium]
MSSYQNTLDYLFAQLPMFQRQGASAFKKDLGNTIALCEALGNPHHEFRSIHVAGTNGKGSTSHFLASILQTEGYRVGLYTSPHLKDFRERIRVNGEMISEDAVIRFTEDNRQHFDRIRPSFFEMTVAMAFHHFREEKVEIAVIETGLGGRLDSTNIITPVLSVITNIGHDHQQFLGETLAEIAGEKAGIIKTRIPVVIGERQEETSHVFAVRAREVSAPVRFASDELELLDSASQLGRDMVLSLHYCRSGSGVSVKAISGLSGPHQHKNVRTVLCAVDVLRHQGIVISDGSLKIGLREVIHRTGILGRWQCLGERPFILCDTAHNKEGIAPIVQQVKAISEGRKLHIVWGMVSDKDHGAIIAILPKDANYYFCRPDIPRGLPAEELREKAELLGLKGTSFNSVVDALRAARMAASKDDVIFVGGSTFVVAEVV